MSKKQDPATEVPLTDLMRTDIEAPPKRTWKGWLALAFGTLVAMVLVGVMVAVATTWFVNTTSDKLDRPAPSGVVDSVRSGQALGLEEASLDASDEVISCWAAVIFHEDRVSLETTRAVIAGDKDYKWPAADKKLWDSEVEPALKKCEP